MPYGRFDLAKRKENSHVLTERFLPSLNIDLSLFFSIIHNLGLANSTSTSDQQNKKKRTRKEPFTIKFDSEVDFTTNFSKGRVSSYIFCTFDRKRLYNSTLSAYTEELKLCEHYFSVFKNSVKGLQK